MLTQQSLSVDFTPVAHYWEGRGGYLPIAIVEGMMAGTLDEARRYFSGVTDDGNEYMVSAHYGIGRDGQVYQFVRDDDSAWSNGILENPDTSIDWIREVHETGVNCNLVTLSVEYEGSPEEGLSEEQYVAALELHRHLVRRWKIEVDPAHIVGKDALDNRFHGGNPGEKFPFMRLLTDLLADAENAPAEPVTPPPVTHFADEIFGVSGATEIEVITPAEIAGETVKLKMEEENDTIVPAPIESSSPEIDPHLRPALTAELLAATAPAEPRQDEGVTSGFLGFIEAEEAAQIDAPPVGDMFDHDLDAAFDRMQPTAIEEIEIRTETAHSELEIDRVLQAYDHAMPSYQSVAPDTLEAAHGLPYTPGAESMQEALGLAEGVVIATKLAEVYRETDIAPPVDEAETPAENEKPALDIPKTGLASKIGIIHSADRSFNEALGLADGLELAPKLAEIHAGSEITPPSEADEKETQTSRPSVQIPTSGLASKIGIVNTPNIRMGAALGLPADIIYIPGTAQPAEPEIELDYSTGVPGAKIALDYAEAAEPELNYVEAAEPELDYVEAAEPQLDYVEAAEPQLDYVEAAEPQLDYVEAAEPQLNYADAAEPELNYAAAATEAPVPAEIEIEHGGKTAHFAPLEENAAIFDSAVTINPEFSAPSAPMVEIAPEVAPRQFGTSDLTPASSRPEASASAARIVDDESPITSAPSAYPFDLTPEPEPSAASASLMYPFELPDSSSPSRTDYDFDFARRETQAQQSPSSFVYPFDLPPAPEPPKPSAPPVETENVPEPQAVDTYEPQAQEVPDSVAPVTDEATFRLLQDLRIPPARVEVKPEPEPTPEIEPEQDEFSRMLAAGILPPDLALEEPEFDLFAPLPPKPVTYAEPENPVLQPEAVAVEPQPGEPDAVFEVAEVQEEEDEPPATSYADAPQTITELAAAEPATPLKGDENIDDLFHVEEVPEDTGPARNVRELSGQFAVMPPFAESETNRVVNPAPESASSEFATLAESETPPAKPASPTLLDFLFDDDDFPTDYGMESPAERRVEPEPSALPKVELPSSAPEFRFDLPDLPPLEVKAENKLPDLPPLGEVKSENKLPDFGSFAPTPLPSDPRGDKVTSKLPDLPELPDFFAAEPEAPAPQQKIAEPETSATSEKKSAELIRANEAKPAFFEDFDQRPLDLKGYTAPLSFEEFDFEPPEEFLGYEQPPTGTEARTNSQPGESNAPADVEDIVIIHVEDKSVEDIVIIHVEDKPVAAEIAEEPAAFVNQASAISSSAESGVNQQDTESSANPELSVPEVIEIGGFPLHLEAIGGGEIAVELANLRSIPAFESGTIMRESEQGERFTFDGWTDGPELFGSTRWLHFKEDGGGWLHSSLIKLDRDAQ